MFFLQDMYVTAAISISLTFGLNIYSLSRLGLAKNRIRVNLDPDKLDIRTTILYSNLVWIINQTLLLHPNPDPNVRCSNSVV